MPETHYRSGFVVLLGRPNVGKSTLVNALVGSKVSIAARRPQTTRHRILGIRSRDQGQIAFVDTPGLSAAKGKGLTGRLGRVTLASLEGVDAVLLVITASGWTEEDERALNVARRAGVPMVLAVNMVDRLPERRRLLPLIDESQRRADFAAIVPVSALTGHNLDALAAELLKLLPEGPQLFPEDQVTDRDERFRAAELVREKLVSQLGEELPYVTAVTIENLDRSRTAVHVSAVIWVEKPSQKGIVIGRGGQRLKRIGQEARQDLEAWLGAHVRLDIWVKVRENWTDSEAALQAFGYAEE